MNELLPFYFQKILKEISGVGHGHQKLLYLELNQSYWLIIATRHVLNKHVFNLSWPLLNTTC